MDYQYRQGGLVRCCTVTLAMAYDVGEPAVDGAVPVEGAKLPCRSCSTQMVYRQGAWEADRSRAPIHGVPVPTEAEQAP